VAGPSGVGKGTVVKALLERVPGLVLSTSVTTRAPRPSERDGVEYQFVSDERFDELVREGALLEWADAPSGSRHRSGTPKGPVEAARAAGRDVVLEIDVQGAGQVRERVPEAILVFLAPPSIDELARRLRSRGTEDDAGLARRLTRATWELEQEGWFDHVVVNDDVERAAERITAIIESSRDSD